MKHRLWLLYLTQGMVGVHVHRVHESQKGRFLLLLALLFPLLPTRFETSVKSPHVRRLAFQVRELIEHASGQISPIVEHFGGEFHPFFAKNGIHHQTNQFFDRILWVL